MRLGLHPPCPQHVHAARLLLGVAEQRGLADPGLTHDGEDAAAAGAGILEQPDERQQLMVAPAAAWQRVYGGTLMRSHEHVGPD